MALINCTECGKEVSDKASVCPNCGAPIHEMNTVPVRFSREKKKFVGTAVSGHLFINGTMIGSVDNGASFEVRLSPGTYQISIQTAQTVGYIAGGKMSSENITIPANAKAVDIEIKLKDSLMGTCIVVGEVRIS